MKATRQLANSLGLYLTAVCLSLAIITGVLRLWRADLHVPFVNGGDGLSHRMWIKSVIENGWYLHNKSVGAPGGLDMHDYPLSDNLHFLLIKLIALAFPHEGLVYNLFFLLTFPLTTVSALLVFRHFHVSKASALVGSLLFAFLPYHCLRLGHIFLTGYYLIPPAVMLALWVYLGQTPFVRWEENNTPKLDLFGSRTIASVVISLLIASAGVYYAFFACFFLGMAGLASYAVRRSIYSLLGAAALIAIILLGVLANLAPTFIYQINHGRNPYAVVRGWPEADIYGMRIIQLLLPVKGHVVPLLSRWRDRYDRGVYPNLSENCLATLGFVASIGFLILLGRFLFRGRKTTDPSLLSGLGLFSVCALFLGCIGGFGCLFNFLAVPHIRSYNRISIYIGFFALFTVTLLLEQVARKYGQTASTRRWYYGLLGLMLILGILDQNPPSVIPAYQYNKEVYYQDEDFVRRVEASLPVGAMLFQLPYMPFPEEPAIHNLHSYEHFRGYLHSKRLRWSYGTMRGRSGDRAQKEIAAQSTVEMVRSLADAGFAGIYIDRNGFFDRGASLEVELSGILESTPLVSSNQRLCFFSLLSSNHKLRLHDALGAVASGGRKALAP